MITKEKLHKLLKEKLVTVKESVSYPGLFVIKYSKRCFYDKKFDQDPLLLEARGLIVDADLNIVCWPLTKVFNRNETPESDFPGDAMVKCVRKVNGFLGVVTYTEKYGWLYSTTGSLDSQFCDYIRGMVDPNAMGMHKINGMTYLFEICHPEDPHIIEEKHGAYLIGVRMPNGEMMSESELDSMASEMHGVFRPESFITQMANVNSTISTCQHEGVMVLELDSDMNQTGRVIKMKSPYYLLLKMIARSKDLEKALTNAKKTKEKVEEELYCIVDAIHDNMEAFRCLDEQGRLAFMKNVLIGNKV